MAGKPFSLGVKALVSDGEGRILLIRRSRESKHFAGQWDLPGGKIDPGETFEQALVREVKEETGLDVELTALAGASEDEMATVRVVLLYLHARSTGKEVELSEEHEESTWAPIGEVAEMDVSDQLRPFFDGLCG